MIKYFMLIMVLWCYGCSIAGRGFFTKNIHPLKKLENSYLFDCDSSSSKMLHFDKKFNDDSIQITYMIDSLIYTINYDSKSSLNYVVINRCPNFFYLIINGKRIKVYTDTKDYCYIYAYKTVLGIKLITYEGYLNLRH